MAPSATKISNMLVKLSGDSPIWSAKCYGNTIIGNANTRPIIVRNGGTMFSSIDYPIYGFGVGYNFGAYDAELLVASDQATPGGLITGKVKVRECFFRESTGERSWAGAESAEIDFGSTPGYLEVQSNAWAYFEQGTVTHRIFYLCYTDKLGVYYEAARVPYTTDTGNNYDSVTINVTAAEIIKNRPLEEQQQTRIFPAVRTGTFWKGRVWGAGLEPRDFAPGTELTFTNGSNLVNMEESSPGVYPDYFTPADTYKGIVDRDTNQIVAYIDRVVHSTQVIIRLPGDTRAISTWQDATVTFDNVGLSGDMANIYATPIYAGGAGGAIVYGIMTWNPLDTLQDEGFYASGAQIYRLVTAGDDLCVIYDRGIGFYTGDVSAGAPPTCRHFVAAKNVGSFNPDSVWQTPSGQVWFQGGGRIYTIQNGNVVDASAQAGVAGIWDKLTERYGAGQRNYQAAMNPQSGVALMVDVPKKGEGTGEYGTYGMAVCHDTQSLHPVRFPVPMYSVMCCYHDTGDWQFYVGTKNGEIYKALVRGQKWDEYIPTGDTETTSGPVPWHYTTGVLWANGTVSPIAVRFLVETDETSGIDLVVAVDTKDGNLNSGTFTADGTVQIGHSDLARLEKFSLNRLAGFAVQYKVSGTTQKAFKLVQMMAHEDMQPARGF